MFYVLSHSNNCTVEYCNSCVNSIHYFLNKVHQLIFPVVVAVGVKNILSLLLTFRLITSVFI